MPEGHCHPARCVSAWSAKVSELSDDVQNQCPTLPEPLKGHQEYQPKASQPCDRLLVRVG
jgi:hypothetical protein